MKKVLAVSGPTASGKSGVAMMLCQKTGFEIVSCDSMQIYKGMDIGTAKPTKEDMARVRHHMIDVADPSRNFSCAEYVSMASECIENIHSRGNVPVICGGTGMYFERLVMTDPIPNMDLAELKQSLTWKFGAFKATLHSVFVCTSTEAMGTDHAIAPHFVGKAAVTLLRIVGAGAAE